MSIHYFGIRHHGPGSARSLLNALKALQPDVLLIEAPADAQDAISLAAHPDIKPPVAVLQYVSASPQQAVYYPFAVFSPEWQALQYSLNAGIPIRLMDLPQTHQFALDEEQRAQAVTDAAGAIAPDSSTDASPAEDADSSTAEETAVDCSSPEANADIPEWLRIRLDPLSWLAQAAGYSDGESWWEHVVEQRQDSRDLFAGIAEAMTALRQQVEALEPPSTVSSDLARRADRENLREAYMRQTIRTAEKEFERIAVVCGAWHVPALQAPLPSAKDDQALLKGLPKAKVSTTWVPWTYSRLQFSSGYGAGIQSPGWYHHLWHHPRHVTTRWIARVARLLRKEDLDASSASVIEAVRLADTLAALRDRPRPSLAELNEAIQTVLCFGDPLPLQIIHRRLILNDRLGAVPAETPAIPLQQDVQQLQKRLRLKPEATEKTLVLDLRKPLDRERSHILHRLNLLRVPWGSVQRSTGTGTFKETWRLQWQPEFMVRLIEAGTWGNTVESAATAQTIHQANTLTDLPQLTTLLDQVLLADLSAVVAHLITYLQATAAVASDIGHLMAALPPLAQISRYSDVRQTDTAAIAHIIDGLVARICIGLPAACFSLDDDAANQMFNHVMAVNSAVQLLQNSQYQADWFQVLRLLSNRQSLHGILAGRCCRLLLDAGEISSETAAQQLHFALSQATEPAQAAAWIEGLLRGSGLLLLHDETLWSVLDNWLISLPNDGFTLTLPLLRRTFSTFSQPERRQMAERVKQGTVAVSVGSSATSMSNEGDIVLPIVAQLLGVRFG
ncbi:MAG: DUF5682 family protein [Thainema sp.]